MSQSKKYFLYVATANVADARNLLKNRGISYDEHEAIQDGIDELAFTATENQRDSLISEIFNSNYKVHFSENKLPITGSIGTISASVTASDMKTGSTDQTAANAKYLKTNSSGELFNASPSTVLAGNKATTSSSSVALASSTACKKVTVQASHDNTDYVLVGNSTNQEVRLYAGDSADVDIDDLSKVYIKRPSSTNVTVNYIGS